MQKTNKSSISFGETEKRQNKKMCGLFYTSPRQTLKNKTDKIDDDKFPIMASLRTNGHGTYELTNIKSNYLTSVYGKDNFEKFFQKSLEADFIIYANKEKIQSLEQRTELQLLRAPSKNFVFNSIIHHQSNNIVKLNDLNSNQQNIIDPQEVETQNVSASFNLTEKSTEKEQKPIKTFDRQEFKHRLKYFLRVKLFLELTNLKFF